jgi:hypothetical protein
VDGRYGLDGDEGDDGDDGKGRGLLTVAGGGLPPASLPLEGGWQQGGGGGGGPQEGDGQFEDVDTDSARNNSPDIHTSMPAAGRGKKKKGGRGQGGRGQGGGGKRPFAYLSRAGANPGHSLSRFDPGLDVAPASRVDNHIRTFACQKATAEGLPNFNKHLCGELQKLAAKMAATKDTWREFSYTKVCATVCPQLFALNCLPSN